METTLRDPVSQPELTTDASPKRTLTRLSTPVCPSWSMSDEEEPSVETRTQGVEVVEEERLTGTAVPLFLGTSTDSLATIRTPRCSGSRGSAGGSPIEEGLSSPSSGPAAPSTLISRREAQR